MKILIILGALLVAAAAKFIFHLKDDNLIEEEVEQVIKDETGVDIDLTPDTPE